jgi:hypothetical protein
MTRRVLRGITACNVPTRSSLPGGLRSPRSNRVREPRESRLWREGENAKDFPIESYLADGALVVLQAAFAQDTTRYPVQQAALSLALMCATTGWGAQQDFS